MKKTLAKKAWTAPKVVVYGTIQEITLGCDKRLGSSDSFTFEGQAIVCTSAS